MADQTPNPATDPDDEPESGPLDEIDPEELKSAKDVLLQLTKTIKTLKIYLPNNPIYQKFLQEVQDKFDSHLRDYETLRIRIRQYELLYKNQVVYQNSNRMESLAFKLYVDGIREITFDEGLEKEEVTSLLEIMGREYDPASPDDDLVTLLWERHFAHIRYLIADDFIEEAAAPIKPPDTAALEQVLEKEKSQIKPEAMAQSMLAEVLGPKLADQATEILTLTQEEITAIKREMVAEEDQDSVTMLMRILTAILRIEKDDQAFSEMVDILDNVMETLVLRGDFWHVSKTLELFHKLMEPGRRLTDFQRRCLLQAVEKAGEPARLKELEPVLSQIGAVDSDQLLNFILQLNENAVEPISDLLGKLNQMKMRRVLVEGLIHLGKKDVRPLLRKLDDSRWFVVRNIIHVLGRIGDERALDKFRKLAGHKEVKIRKEIITAVDGMKNPRALELLRGFIGDLEPSIRILAIRSLAKEGNQEALPVLEDLIEDPDFGFRDLYEKREIFDALGRIGGETVLPKMRTLVRKGGSAWFKKAVNEERGLCAVIALKRIGTEEAIAVLREGRGLSSKVIREACTKTLSELGASSEKKDG